MQKLECRVPVVPRHAVGISSRFQGMQQLHVVVIRGGIQNATCTSHGQAILEIKNQWALADNTWGAGSCRGGLGVARTGHMCGSRSCPATFTSAPRQLADIAGDAIILGGGQLSRRLTAAATLRSRPSSRQWPRDCSTARASRRRTLSLVEIVEPFRLEQDLSQSSRA